MKLADLIGCVEGARLEGDPATPVAELAYDSRRVRPGCLFVCIPGLRTDGHRYAAEAVRRGATALVVERDPEGIPPGIPLVRVPHSRQALAVLAAEMTGRPADRLLMVGITGTNGKTSTAYLTEAVLRARGRDPGLLGTIEARVGGEVRHLPHTTPESLDLHRLFAEMEGAGHDAVVMEVSSHALALDRTRCIPYDIGIFTNLGHDHLDFHGDMERYLQAKLRLFHKLGTRPGRPCRPYAVVNLDDPYGRRVLEVLRVPFVTYGTAPPAHVRAEDVRLEPEGVAYTVVTPVGSRPVRLQVSGLFNVHNSLAAISAGLALRVDLAAAVAAVEGVAHIPGRFERIREGQDFTVLVDYAHTPDSLGNLLRSVRRLVAGRVLAVYGCGGDRDPSKRPLMGRIGGECADWVILTSDNPRSEDPREIAAQIEVGLRLTGCPYLVELDRAEAIRQALERARPGDAVVIAGKGHEQVQIFGDRTIWFDDAEVARRLLRSRPFPGGGEIRPGAERELLRLGRPGARWRRRTSSSPSSVEGHRGSG